MGDIVGLKQTPEWYYIELFRVVRGAGRSNKATALSARPSNPAHTGEPTMGCPLQSRKVVMIDI